MAWAVTPAASVGDEEGAGGPMLFGIRIGGGTEDEVEKEEEEGACSVGACLRKVDSCRLGWSRLRTLRLALCLSSRAPGETPSLKRCSISRRSKFLNHISKPPMHASHPVPFLHSFSSSNDSATYNRMSHLSCTGFLQMTLAHVSFMALSHLSIISSASISCFPP